MKIKPDRTTGTVSDCPVGGCVCVKIKRTVLQGVSDCPVGGYVCVKIKPDRTTGTVSELSRRGLRLCEDQTGPYYRYGVRLSRRGLRLCEDQTGPYYRYVSDFP